MKKIQLLPLCLVIALTCSTTACKKMDDQMVPGGAKEKLLTREMMSENGANPDEVTLKFEIGNLTLTKAKAANSGHYLYTETNEAGMNEIMIFDVKTSGHLSLMAKVASGGMGTGMGLGSQGALVLDDTHENLYAVNAGDNTISSFKVKSDGNLKLSQTIASGGKTPVSIAVHDNLLYVLNRGSDAIQGFAINPNGKLKLIADANQHLSGIGVDAPQISFTPNGFFVVVTEKATNKIGTFQVKNDGSIMAGKFTASEGQTPFGFDWSRNKYMIVSNAAGGAMGAGSSTAYSINNNGIPKYTNGAVASAQAAPCWVATTKNGRFAYVTNTASNNVSSYYIAGNGGLYLAKAIAAPSGSSPIDVVVCNNFYLYVLTAKSNTIDEFYREEYGELNVLGHTSRVPSSATGLATF